MNSFVASDVVKTYITMKNVEEGRLAGSVRRACDA